MADTQTTKASTIPEPPKFNIDDLPSPPRMDMDMPEMKQKQFKVPSPAQNIDSSSKTSQEGPKTELKSPVVVPRLEEMVPDLNKNALEDLIPPKPSEKKSKNLFGLFGKKEMRPQVKPDSLKIEAPNFGSSNIPDVPKIDSSPKKIEIPPDFPKAQFVEIKSELSEPAKFSADSQFEPPKNFLELSQEKQGGDAPKEENLLEEGEKFLDNQTDLTPLTDVKGVGPKREKDLRKIGVKSAEHLALHSHKNLAKKLKLPEYQMKAIIGHAEKITRIRKRIKDSRKDKGESISDVIRNLENEKKTIERLQKGDKTEEKIMQLEGHKEIIEVLSKLEKKRSELLEMQRKINEKEMKLSGADVSYKRDIEYIDHLKRRLDHDVRERTQYLMNMEKEYFQRAQDIAKKQSDIESKNKSFVEKEQYLKDRDLAVKKKLSDLQDREITLESKERKISQMMNGLDRQDVILKEKEEDLVKREEEYLKKLDILEHHEKSILKNLEEKRVSLAKKEKEIEMRESRLSQQQRNVDKKGVAVEYAKNIIETEKSKLVDDEFEQYLKDQLGRISSPGITKNDIDIVSSLRVPNMDDKNKTVYTLIDTCRAMLHNSRLSEAKMYYNQVREKYYSTPFSGQKEKENIHNMIRSLYDEINLAEIGRNR